jgi:hypothetical protein
MYRILLLALALTLSLANFAQRPSTKDFRIEMLERPTVPEELVRNVAFRIHVEHAVFNLDGLRLFGKAMEEMKSGGERLAGMKYFTLGQEAEVVEEFPTLIVDIAMGEFTASPPRINATPIAKDSEEKYYTASIDCEWPMQIMLRDVDGNLYDAFNIDGMRTIGFGNEDYTKIEGRRAGFSYEKGKWDFRSESDLRAELATGDGIPRVMWKMFLRSFSDMIDELETRLYFIEGKVSIELGSAKGRKVDYTALDEAIELAETAFDANDFSALDAPMGTWTEWLSRADYINPKADVNAEIAVELMLNMATAHIYRGEWAAAAGQLASARKYVTPMGDLGTRVEKLTALLAHRRKAELNNGDRTPGEEEEIYKAVDFKDLVAKRSQNKDVQLFFDEDVFQDFVEEYQTWEATVLGDAPEMQAQQAEDMTMGQWLGTRVTQVPGGVSLGLVGMIDAHLVGQPFPAEILDIERLVNLTLNGLKLENIPSEISKIATLKTLDLTGNNLADLPTTIGDLALLQRLILRNNQLTGLPESLANCVELKMVDLRGNDISPETSAQLQSLLGEKVKIKVD